MTDELDIRKRLIHSDRLASLGVLAAGVAHEINNPAAFILLGTQQLSRMIQQLPDDLPSRPRMQEIVSDLQEGVQRIARIVGELRLFARSEEQGMSTPVDVNDLIRSALTLTQAQLRHRGRLDSDLQAVPLLPGEHLRLVQVFVNLLVNAAQALPPGSEDKNLVRVHSSYADGWITVEIADNGVGIAEENIAKVFDMFYTTKAPGEGTGLGLSIASDLVQRAGGRIEVHSTVGEGTRFTVKIPVPNTPASAAPTQAATRPSSPPLVAAMGIELLLIEDESALAAAVTRALAPRFSVKHVTNGAAALELLLQPESERFAVILCDLRMPGMDGTGVFQGVRSNAPELAKRFVFLTGISANDTHTEFLRTCGQPVLEKPFQAEELDGALATILQT